MGNGFYDLPCVGNIVQLTDTPVTELMSRISDRMDIKIVTDNPKQFRKAHEDDAGYDLLSSQTVVISKGCAALVETGLRVKVPKHHVGIIKSRSGLAVKHNLEVGAGVIDHGYIGEVKVLIRNFGILDYTIEPGDKIAQMLVIPIFNGHVKRVEKLENTTRGSGGFNSTGYN